MKMRFILSAIVLCVSLCLLTFVVSLRPVQAAATHVVISQIQIGGASANQEFVEIYNPTNVTISLSGWRLSREASSAASFSTLVSSMSGSIAPHGYLLIAHPTYTNVAVPADILYSATSSGIAKDNTVALFSDAGNTLVDKVGMGFAADKETLTFQNPDNGQSIVRKASLTSSATTLLPGGMEEHDGNGFDSDNNSSDFVLFTTALPHNSKTPAAPAFISSTPIPSLTNSPTPTVSLTPTFTVTPTLTPTQTPTLTPSPSPMLTPTPTITPTKAPTNTPTPTMTMTPSPTFTPTPTFTVTPTQSPTPTVTPNQTMTPTPTVSFTVTPTPSIISEPTGILTPTIQMHPTITPTPTQTLHHGPFGMECSWKFRVIHVGRFTFRIPYVHCERENRHRR